MKQFQLIHVQGNRDGKGIDQPLFNHAANPLQPRPAVFPGSWNGEQLEISGAAFLKKRIEPAANPVEIRVSEREYIIGKQSEVQGNSSPVSPFPSDMFRWYRGTSISFSSSSTFNALRIVIVVTLK